MGEDGLYRALVKSENPVVAFVADKDPETGEDRNDRIVLVTDEEVANGLIISVMQVATKGRINLKKVKVNKTITAYDRQQIDKDIETAIEDGRLLYFDKKRSQHLAGRPGSNYQVAIRSIDFTDSIRNFWSNVNRKKQENKNKFSAEGKEESSLALAFEKAKENSLQSKRCPKQNREGNTENTKKLRNIFLR